MATKKKAQKIMKGVSSRTVGGETYWYATLSGRKTYMGKGDEARKSATAAKAKEVLSKHETRELRGGLDVKRSKFMTFKDLHEWYFSLPEVQGQRIYNGKIARLGHLVDFFGNRPLNQFEADEQGRYRHFRTNQKAASGTIDNEIKLLSAMFHAAVKSKLLPSSVMPTVFDRHDEYIPRRTVTEEEYEKLLEKANPDFRDFLICGYETGMRLDEIMELRASRVHLDVKHISGRILDYISLGIFDTKTKAQRHIPVSAALKPVLASRMQGLGRDDYVFKNSHGNPYKYESAIVLLMKSTCQRAKVLYGSKVNESGERDGITFHCLRHTRITKWVEAGFSDEIIRRASGHHSLAAYRVYVNITDPLPIMNLVISPEKTGKIGTKTGYDPFMKYAKYDKSV
jgi:integrase